MIKIIQGTNEYEAEVNKQENLLSFLRSRNFVISAPCNGNGKCGMCKLKVNGDEALACKTEAKDGQVITLPETLHAYKTTAVHENYEGAFKAAVDLGTSTVYVALMAGERCIAENRAWNCLSPFGADVISRIQYTMVNENGLEDLSSRLRNQVKELVGCDGAFDFNDCTEIYISGNTVMEHLFAAIDPQSIAQAPYVAKCLFRQDMADFIDGVPVKYAPCVASYVGGDAVAGLVAAMELEEWKQAETALFIDFGTNSEMILKKGDEFFCCSAACGPAFELASNYGVYGSEMINILAGMLKKGVLDESGLLFPDEDYDTPPDYIDGEIRISSADIRNLQLAKAAAAAGIEVMLDEAAMKAGDIEALFISGNFGVNMNFESAAAIGMIPYQLRNRAHLLGNTSLKGAMLLSENQNLQQEAVKISEKCRYLELSSDSRFTDYFSESLFFDIFQ